MRSKALSVLILTTILLSLSAATTANAAKPVAVVLAKGALAADKQLAAMMADFSWVEWRAVFTELTPADLDGASFLLMLKIDSSVEYADAEVAAVKDWFAKGGKTLWVASDSDFPPNDVKRQASTNKILEAVGSRLRSEAGAVEDPTSMADSPYRVLGVVDACDAPVKFLVEGVTRALFHGPGPIVGYVNGKYVSLEKSTIDGVYKVATSTDKGELKDNDPTVAPQVHVVGDPARLTLMAVDFFDYTKKNMVIATGEAPIAQYQGLYKPEVMDPVRYGTKYPTQGERLFDNILTFALGTKNVWMADQVTIAAKTAQATALQTQVTTLTGEKTTLQGQVTTLTNDKNTLTAEKTALTADKTTLQGQVKQLQTDLAAANSNTGSWQIYAVGLLVIGVVAGVFVGPMVIKKK